MKKVQFQKRYIHLHWNQWDHSHIFKEIIQWGVLWELIKYQYVIYDMCPNQVWKETWPTCRLFGREIWSFHALEQIGYMYWCCLVELRNVLGSRLVSFVHVPMVKPITRFGSQKTTSLQITLLRIFFFLGGGAGGGRSGDWLFCVGDLVHFLPSTDQRDTFW